MMIWYVVLAAFTVALTYVLWLKQGSNRQKQWLVQQLQTEQNETQHQALHQALKQNHSASKGQSITILITLLLMLPLALLLQQLTFDNQTAPEASDQETPDLLTAIRQLEAKLAQNPNDIQGQLLYAQSMVAMKQYEQAAAAYAKANELQPNDAAILTEWAEAIAFRNNTGSFLGQPESLLQQALAINPKHQKAMWLYGIVLHENQQYEAAEKIWTELMSMVNSTGVQDTLRQQINQARAAQNKPPLESPQLVSYAVEVEASGDLPADAVLFVLAKSTDGMPMPIAVQKIIGPFDFPMTVTLSDVNNLQPNRPLNGFTEVLISAHLSLTGTVEDKSWLSETTPAKPQQNITLHLKRNEHE